MTDSRWSHARALVLGGLGAVAVQWTFVFALGWDYRPSYLGLCLLLGWLPAWLGAGLCGLGLALPSALVLWAAFAGWFTLGPLGALSIAGTAWLVVRSARPPLVRALLVMCLLTASTLLTTFWRDHALVSWAPAELRRALATTLAFGVCALLATRVLRWLKWPAAAEAAGLVALTCLGVAALCLPRRTSPPEPRFVQSPPSESPHIVVVVLDTVRADHLSIYGYERETTPRLAEWIQERDGLVAPAAFSNGTWTVPSHATLFTGLRPAEHHARFGATTRAGFTLNAERTLAEALAERGYSTLAVFSNGWLARVRGMDRGFHAFHHAARPPALPALGEALRASWLPGLFGRDTIPMGSADDVHERVYALLDEAPPGPKYLFINLADAHGPYVPTAETRGAFAPWSPFEVPDHLAIDQDAQVRSLLMARYDEEILMLDRAVDELLGELDARGILDRAWVFVTSDHGEAFGEHGVTEHGTTVHNEVTRVPLVVLPPRGAALSELPHSMGLADIAETVARIAGTSLESTGTDLRVAGSVPTVEIEFYGDHRKVPQHGALAGVPATAVVRGRHKLIRTGTELALYDLATDPGETLDISAAHPELTRELEALLPLLPIEAAPKDDWEEILSPEELRELQAFGYLGGDE